MPTGFGYAFAAVAVVLLILAIGYMNNLLYVFVFLLISMALTSMLTTNKNIDLLALDQLTASLLYANEVNTLTATFRNKNNRASIWDLFIKVRLTPDIPTQMLSQVKPFTSETISVQWKPAMRGLTQLPRLHAQSRFPFRLLVAWKYFEKETQAIVYPERKGSLPLPQLAGSSAEQEANALVDKDGFFRDYREFQRGDSPSRIAWRKSLKLQRHLVKNFESSGDKKVLIDWVTTASLINPEDRISQIALWIDLCHNSHVSYSLKIKDYQSPFASGLQHYKQLMQKLALLTPEEYQ